MAVDVFFERIEGPDAYCHLAQAPVPDFGGCTCCQDEFGVGITGIYFTVHQRPGPVFETIEFLHGIEGRLDPSGTIQIECDLVEGSMLKPPTSQVKSERFGPGLIEANADDFHFTDQCTNSPGYFTSNRE